MDRDELPLPKQKTKSLQGRASAQILDYYKRFGQNRDLEKYLMVPEMARSGANLMQEEPEVAHCLNSEIGDHSRCSRKEPGTSNPIEEALESDLDTFKSLQSTFHSAKTKSGLQRNKLEPFKDRSTTVKRVSINVDSQANVGSSNVETKSLESSPEIDSERQEDGNQNLDSSNNKAVSPSSSVTSRRLEWDSLADVGYANADQPGGTNKNLSTLERMALDSQFKSNEFLHPGATRMQLSCEITQTSIKKDNVMQRIGVPDAQSTPIIETVKNPRKIVRRRGLPRSSPSRTASAVRIHGRKSSTKKSGKAHADSKSNENVGNVYLDLTKHFSINLDVNKDAPESDDLKKKNVTHFNDTAVSDKQIQTSVRDNASVSAQTSRVASRKTSLQSDKLAAESLLLNPTKSTSHSVHDDIKIDVDDNLQENVDDLMEDDAKIDSVSSSSVPADYCNALSAKGSESILSRAESFEYMPGHLYQNIKLSARSRSLASSSKESLLSPGSHSDRDDGVDDSQRSASFSRDHRRSINEMSKLINSGNRDSELIKSLIKKVVERLVKTDYPEDRIRRDVIGSAKNKNNQEKSSLGEQLSQRGERAPAPLPKQSPIVEQKCVTVDKLDIAEISTKYLLISDSRKVHSAPVTLMFAASSKSEESFKPIKSSKDIFADDYIKNSLKHQNLKDENYVEPQSAHPFRSLTTVCSPNTEHSESDSAKHIVKPKSEVIYKKYLAAKRQEEIEKKQAALRKEAKLRQAQDMERKKLLERKLSCDRMTGATSSASTNETQRQLAIIDEEMLQLVLLKLKLENNSQLKKVEAILGDVANLKDLDVHLHKINKVNWKPSKDNLDADAQIEDKEAAESNECPQSIGVPLLNLVKSSDESCQMSNREASNDQSSRQSSETVSRDDFVISSSGSYQTKLGESSASETKDFLTSTNVLCRYRSNSLPNQSDDGFHVKVKTDKIKSSNVNVKEMLIKGKSSNCKCGLNVNIKASKQVPMPLEPPDSISELDLAKCSHKSSKARHPRESHEQFMQKNNQHIVKGNASASTNVCSHQTMTNLRNVDVEAEQYYKSKTKSCQECQTNSPSELELFLLKHQSKKTKSSNRRNVDSPDEIKNSKTLNAKDVSKKSEPAICEFCNAIVKSPIEVTKALEYGQSIDALPLNVVKSLSESNQSNSSKESNAPSSQEYSQHSDKKDLATSSRRGYQLSSGDTGASAVKSTFDELHVKDKLDKTKFDKSLNIEERQKSTKFSICKCRKEDNSAKVETSKTITTKLSHFQSECSTSRCVVGPRLCPCCRSNIISTDSSPTSTSRNASDLQADMARELEKVDKLFKKYQKCRVMKSFQKEYDELVLKYNKMNMPKLDKPPESGYSKCEPELKNKSVKNKKNDSTKSLHVDVAKKDSPRFFMPQAVILQEAVDVAKSALNHVPLISEDSTKKKDRNNKGSSSLIDIHVANVNKEKISELNLISKNSPLKALDIISQQQNDDKCFTKDGVSSDDKQYKKSMEMKDSANSSVSEEFSRKVRSVLLKEYAELQSLARNCKCENNNNEETKTVQDVIDKNNKVNSNKKLDTSNEKCILNNDEILNHKNHIDSTYKHKDTSKISLREQNQDDYLNEMKKLLHKSDSSEESKHSDKITLENKSVREPICFCQPNKSGSPGLFKCSSCRRSKKLKYISQIMKKKDAIPKPIAYDLILEPSESIFEETFYPRREPLEQVVVKYPVLKKSNQTHKSGAQKSARSDFIDKESEKFYTYRCNESSDKESISPIELDTTRKMTCTVEEYLRINDSKFVNAADKRKEYLKKKHRKREQNYPNARNFLTSVVCKYPNLKEISLADLKYLAEQNGLLIKNPEEEIINTEEAIRKTAQKYGKLPEIQSKKECLKKEESRKTNKLMANIFSKELKKKTLKGILHISNNSNVVSL